MRRHSKFYYMWIRQVSSFPWCSGGQTGEIVRLIGFPRDPITEFFYRSEDIGDRGEVLDLRVTQSHFHRIVVTVRVFLLTKLDDLLGQYNRVNFFFRCFHGELESIGVMSGGNNTPLLQHSLCLYL